MLLTDRQTNGQTYRRTNATKNITYWMKLSESADLLDRGRLLPPYCPQSRSTKVVAV